VLRLLAEGLTNAEIAERLVITVPTVKSHTRNLYGKLGVHGRRAAVVQARTLGLL
jgi:LuxR family maltose regulon positive regulatory protein